MSDVNTSTRLPTVEEEARFWGLVEAAWERLGPEPAALRRALLTRDPALDDDGVYAVDAWWSAFFDSLGTLCADLSGAELTDLDRVVERKLYDIDRVDVHEVTDGSDDGFLYARGHIVALGREFYEAVRADPTRALPDGYVETICYYFAHLHDKRFGEWPQTGSGISRESCSNRAGWAEQAAESVSDAPRTDGDH
ncbi:DUF4240 domain-containing protein [Micromonospora sp. NPDC092111]|uniref:DUF4240 domain-containing protein n=1 Tax=Micromonospora sp. NPDC092111 TaxID=3364289 RepID=UPI0037F14D50